MVPARGEMRSHYSHLGCPSVCPELMVRMLLVGYCYSIRSERRLCQEVKMNLCDFPRAPIHHREIRHIPG
jgi:hypothetical protein